MNMLLENTAGIGIVGAALGGLLLFAAKQLGDRRLFYAAIGIGFATLILCAISTLIDTEREKLTKTIYDVANAVRANDHQRALDYMHPNATPATQRAKSELARFKFEEAKVTSIRMVTVNESTRPQTATTEFVGRIKVKGDHTYYGMEGSGVRLMKVYWMKSGDRWLISDYEHSDVREALKN